MITNSWLDGANLWMYWMAEQGYLVFTLDNRGSGERGFAFENQIHRQLGVVEMKDQMKGIDYLKSLSYVDTSRFAVHGWSFGGFMTTSLMLKQSETFKVGVAGGPVTDWKYYEVMYGERYMDRPEENAKGYEEASLFTHANKLKGDLLLIHGTVDDVVVPQHNDALIKKFIDLGVQVDFFHYPMHKHNVIGRDRVHLIQKVLDYIIENNK
jgi:dipeptidyl-peptidase 4